MPKFPVDAPIARVIAAFERLGFQVVRVGNHIAMVRENSDGTRTPLTMPNHRTLKGSTLRTILSQAGIARADFIQAYEEAKSASTSEKRHRRLVRKVEEFKATSQYVSTGKRLPLSQGKLP